jgi:signal peptidase I
VLSLSGGADVSRSASRTTFIALQASMGVLGLWTLIATMLMLGRVHRFGFWRTVLCVVLGGLATLLLALVFRSFLYQPFNTPSGSMKPTLLVGDQFFVSKFRYGYSKYSLPLSPPLFSGRVFASEPQLGDVVVFRLPRDDSTDYIKRVTGLPGDTVQMLGGVLQINGQPVKRERIADLVETEGTRTSRAKQWRETLPNGVSYTTLDLVDNGLYDNTQVYQVPAGHYFMLGDNRDNSTDSRVRPERGGVGYVPFENLVGRAEIIFQSVDDDARGRQPAVRFDRIGTVVR